TMAGDESEAEHIHLSGVDIQLSAVLRAVDTFGEDHFPANAISERQFGSDAPLVLRIPEEAFLALLRIRAAADVALKTGNGTQHEVRHSEPANGRAARR